MVKTRIRQMTAAFLGLVLSATVLSASAEDRAVDRLDSQADLVKTGNFRGESVLTQETQHFIKVADRHHRSDRGRDSHRGKGHRDRRSDRGRDSYRGTGHRSHRSDHGRYSYRGRNHRDYRSDRGRGHYRGKDHRHWRHDSRHGDDRLLWYGLGVLTPLLLDEWYY
jgi:hypothetical protein